jgi:hypothetical protein
MFRLRLKVVAAVCLRLTNSRPPRKGWLFSELGAKPMDADFEFENYQEFTYTPEQNQLLEDLLKTLPPTLTVETKVFVKAILELERQEEIKGYSMLTLIRHMAMHLEMLKERFYTPDPLCAKSRLYHLFLPAEAWSRLFTKEFIEQWQLEAEKQIFQNESNN